MRRGQAEKSLTAHTPSPIHLHFEALERFAAPFCSAVPIGLLARCLPLLVLLAGCGGKESVSEDILRPVRTQVVYGAGSTRQRTFSGTARAGVESQLSFKVGGLVEQVPVSVGQSVKAGQLIARLEPTDYELQVQDAEALLAQARSQARNAQANYERIEALYENNNASRSDLDAALASKESAEAQVASVDKKLELARLQLSYTRLLAPFEGSIASVSVEVNENVAAGQPVAKLTGGEVPEVEVTIPENLISAIREGDSVRVRFDAVPDADFVAHITEVAVAATDFATTYPVKVRLLRADARVRPGMAAEVEFTLAARRAGGAILVPAVAVAEDHHGRFVYVVADSAGVGMVVRRRDVTVGDLTGEGIEIRRGLQDGERIVTAGVSRLTEGQRVKLLAGEIGE